MSKKPNTGVIFTYVVDVNHEFVCKAKYGMLCGYGEDNYPLKAQRMACKNLFKKMAIYTQRRTVVDVDDVMDKLDKQACRNYRNAKKAISKNAHISF